MGITTTKNATHLSELVLREIVVELADQSVMSPPQILAADVVMQIVVQSFLGERQQPFGHPQVQLCTQC